MEDTISNLMGAITPDPMRNIIPFKGYIVQWEDPMVIKHASLDQQYDVFSTLAPIIQEEVRRHGYRKEDSYFLPLECWRDGNIVVGARWDVRGGPQGDTNGHGQTGATSSASAALSGANGNLNGQANGSTGSSNGNNGPTGTS